MLLHPAILIFTIVIATINCQNPSPCPRIFTYEPKDKSTDDGPSSDRWYGNIALQTANDLEGIWLKIELDRKAELLGNWFGDAVTSDNREFKITNDKYRLEAGAPVNVRIFVKYNVASVIPSLKSIKVNGNVICGATRVASTTPRLHISQLNTKRPSDGDSYNGNNRLTTEGPAVEDLNYVRPAVVSRPGSFSNPTQARPNPGSDFFAGDFSVVTQQEQTNTRPQVNGGGANNNRPPTLEQRKNVKCGTMPAKASPFIAFGQNTSQGDWPWHAAIFHTEGIQQMYTCGATLISENYLVTAAHCVAKPRSERPISNEDIIVYLGKHNLKKQGATVQSREIDDIFIHPQYNHSVYFNDIAILKMAQPAEYTNYVRPCCLWEESRELDSVLDREGTVVGWGFDENRHLSINLMQARMPVVSTVKCIYSNRDFFSQFTFEKNFCAGFRNGINGTSVCNGDSGSGMFFTKNNVQPAQWQLRGIVSVGVALQSLGVCDASQYVVFTDVAQHLDWIKQVTHL